MKKHTTNLRDASIRSSYLHAGAVLRGDEDGGKPGGGEAPLAFHGDPGRLRARGGGVDRPRRTALHAERPAPAAVVRRRRRRAGLRSRLDPPAQPPGAEDDVVSANQSVGGAGAVVTAGSSFLALRLAFMNNNSGQ